MTASDDPWDQEWSDEWADPDRQDLILHREDLVLVLTDEGCYPRRGPGSRWTPGETIGKVLSKHRLHERCWHIEIPDVGIFLFFDDEVAPCD